MQINAEYINYEIIAEQNIQIIDTSTVLHFLFPFDFSDNSPLYDRSTTETAKEEKVERQFPELTKASRFAVDYAVH